MVYHLAAQTKLLGLPDFLSSSRTPRIISATFLQSNISNKTKQPLPYTYIEHTDNGKNRFLVGNTLGWWRWSSLRREIMVSYPLCFPKLLWRIRATVTINQQHFPSLRWISGQNVSNLLTAPTWSSWSPSASQACSALSALENSEGFMTPGPLPTWWGLEVSKCLNSLSSSRTSGTCPTKYLREPQWPRVQCARQHTLLAFLHSISPSPVPQLCSLGSLHR